MLDYILYRNIAGGTAIVAGEAETSVELLGVVSNQAGLYEVKAKGGVPSLGDMILLPIKGSKQMSLKLPVKTVSPLITPVGAWSAECKGPDVKEFQLRQVQVCCDVCAKSESVEFVEYSDDFNRDALSGLELLGWDANAERQICPDCREP